jgi:hypothetical protein
MEAILVKTDEFKSLISKAPEVLEENRMSYRNASEAGKTLISEAAEGMDDILDDRLSKFIAKVKTTVRTMKEKREPFTQVMTAIAKEFTSLESGLKDPMNECQKLRDAYATLKMKERQERERLAALKLAKENELVTAVAEYKTKYSEAYADFVFRFKQKEMKWLNELTLETIENAEKCIALVGECETEGSFNFRISLSPFRYASPYEFNEYFTEKDELPALYFGKFKAEIQYFKREIQDLLPSKRNQLEEAETRRIADEKARAEEEERRKKAEEEARIARIAAEKADAENKARMEEEARKAAVKLAAEKEAAEAAEAKRREEELRRSEAEAKRREEEEADMKREAEEKAEKEAAEAAVRSAEKKAGLFVDSQADLFAEAPKVKEGYKITVTDNAGYLPIMQFWYEHEGKKLSPDKFEAVTVARMKAFAERFSSKTETFIESGFLKYETVYKAK